MFKYRHDYKYIKIDVNNFEIIIELSRDNTLGKMTYSAKTNLMFLDEFDCWGHAVGVGRSEEDALEMCYNEMHNYTNQDFEYQPEIVEIPQKIVYEYKKETIVLNFEECGDKYIILTPNGKKEIVSKNIIKTIADNQKEFASDSIPYYDEKLFTQFEFGKPFDTMTAKYENNSLDLA